MMRLPVVTRQVMGSARALSDATRRLTGIVSEAAMDIDIDRQRVTARWHGLSSSAPPAAFCQRSPEAWHSRFRFVVNGRIDDQHSAIVALLYQL
jgi:hypothetical protein